MRYGHELTPAEQQQPPTMVVPAEQIQALATPDTARVSDVDQSILAATYEAANRRANAVAEQRGIQNDLARTALGQVFTGAANVGGNRVAVGRLRGTDASGAPIFEKAEAQAERQRAWGARQAASPAQALPQEFGPRAAVTYPQPGPMAPVQPREAATPTRASEASDPYYKDMVEAHREQRREEIASTQRSDPTSAASRLDRQPKPAPDEDAVFDDPLGNSKR